MAKYNLKEFFLQIFCWLLLTHQSSGFNFVVDQFKEHRFETGQMRNTDSLFGWSATKFQTGIAIGAPGTNEGTGAVVFCSSNLETCTRLDSTEYLPAGYFGWSIATDGFDLYTCAPFAYLSQYGIDRLFTTGVCYKYSSTTFDPVADFKISNGAPPRLGNVFTNAIHSWYTGSIYGYSITGWKNSLMVGAPFLKDKVTAKRSQRYSGGIVQVSGKNFVLPDVSRANYALKESEVSSGVVYNLAGEAVATGKFENSSNEEQIVISAPKAERYRGKVYICGDCFSNHQTSDGKNYEVTGSQIGERFGSSVASCDVDGNGMDDLLIGAPLYATSAEAFETGRVYIFLKKDKLIPGKPPTVEPKRKNSSGGRFGTSVTCLGDISGDGFGDFAVGAPYYQGAGAVYIFYGGRDGVNTNIPPQIIFSQALGPNLIGLGKVVLGVSGDHASTCSLFMTAHISSAVAVIKSRPVIHFTPDSAVHVFTQLIEMDSGLDTIQIQLLIRHKVPSVNTIPANLTAEVSFHVDKRLRPSTIRIFHFTLQKTDWKLETFYFQSRLDTFSDAFASGSFTPKPITIQPIVQWKLVSPPHCDTNDEFLTNSFCPILDPEFEKDEDKSREMLPEVSIPFKRKCWRENCPCHLHINPNSFETVVKGKDKNIVKIPVSLTNDGPHEAFDLEVSPGTDSNIIQHLTIVGCYTADNVAQCPRLEPSGIMDLTIQFSVNEEVAPNQTDFSVMIKSSCKKLLSLRLKLYLLPHLQFQPSQKSESYVKINPGTTLKHFQHQYEIVNRGWLQTGDGRIEVLIPFTPDFLTVEQVRMEMNGPSHFTQCPRMENQGNKTRFLCTLSSLLEERQLLLEIHFLLTVDQTNRLDNSSQMAASSKISGQFSGVEVSSSYETVIVFYKPGSVQELLKSWDVLLGISVGIIAIFLITGLLYRFDVFSKVRLYKEEMDIIASARNSAKDHVADWDDNIDFSNSILDNLENRFSHPVHEIERINSEEDAVETPKAFSD